MNCGRGTNIYASIKKPQLAQDHNVIYYNHAKRRAVKTKNAFPRIRNQNIFATATTNN